MYVNSQEDIAKCEESEVQGMMRQIRQMWLCTEV